MSSFHSKDILFLTDINFRILFDLKNVSVLTSGEDGKAPNQQKLYHQKSCGTSWKQLQLKAESVALSPNCLLSCPDAQLFGCHRPRGSWNTKATFCVDKHSREGNPHTTKKNMGCVCVLWGILPKFLFWKNSISGLNWERKKRSLTLFSWATTHKSKSHRLRIQALPL